MGVLLPPSTLRSGGVEEGRLRFILLRDPKKGIIGFYKNPIFSLIEDAASSLVCDEALMTVYFHCSSEQDNPTKDFLL